MNDLFNLDNPFMQFLFKVSDLIILNAIFIISCIPLFTIGASISALHSVCMKMVRGRDPYMWSGYWKAFRQNFKQSTIVWLISVALFIFFALDFRILGSLDLELFSIMKVALSMVALVLFCMFIYIFPIIAHFKCTIKQAIKNSFFMTIAHLPFTLLLVLMYGLIGFLLTFSVKTMALVLMIALICGFSVVVFTACIIFNHIFKKYEPEEEVMPEP